jgi:type 1 fimbria pilin
VRKLLPLLALIAAFAAPAAAMAGNTVDPTLIPDGTYNATVEKVVDNKHVTVKLDNGMEATVTTNRPNVDFGKVKPNDQIKMSLIKGLVAVYIVTPH